MAASIRKDVQAHDKENPSLQSMGCCFPCKTDGILKQWIFLSFGEGVCDMDMRVNLCNMFRDQFGKFCQHLACASTYDVAIPLLRISFIRNTCTSAQAYMHKDIHSTVFEIANIEELNIHSKRNR